MRLNKIRKFVAPAMLFTALSLGTSVNAYADQGNSLFKEENGEIDLNIDSSVAGIGVALTAMNDAIEDGSVDNSALLDIYKIVDDKVVVLDDYKKIGVADVEGYNYLNVRKKPSLDGEVCGKMTTYAACEVLKKEGDWYKIRSGAVTGYAYAEYIITGEEAERIAVEEAELMAVVTTKSNLNVRKKASTKGKLLTQITKDERYEVLGKKKGFVKISLDGLTDSDGDELDSYGYIASDYCDVRYALKAAVPYEELDESGNSGYTSTRASLCNYACRFIGNPYVWGGTSLTHGADCSGFVMSVFANYGVYLPHSSRAQAYCGTRINSSQMKPGDLVFYGRYGIDHVAIYIGNGQIVHAANTRRGIVINSWNYMTPVRIVNVLGN